MAMGRRSGLALGAVVGVVILASRELHRTMTRYLTGCSRGCERACTALIAGVGNIFLGDDGFGVEVARRLASMQLPEGVRVADFGIRGIHLAYELLEMVTSRRSWWTPRPVAASRGPST